MTFKVALIFEWVFKAFIGFRAEVFKQLIFFGFERGSKILLARFHTGFMRLLGSSNAFLV